MEMKNVRIKFYVLRERKVLMDNHKKELKKNIFYTVVYQGLSFLYPLLVTPTISKAFGTETLGIYSYTYSIAYYFSLLACLGIHTYGSRLVSIQRDEKIEVAKVFKELYTIQCVSSILSILIYFIYVFCFAKKYCIYALLQVFVIIVAMVDLSWFISGIEQFKAMTTRNIVIKLISLLLILFNIHTEEDLWKYIIIVGCTNTIGQLLMWPFVQRYLCKVHISIKEISKHIIPILKFFLPVLAINAYVFIDKVMLGIFQTMKEVGYYENCDKIIRMPIGLAYAATAAIIPRAAYYIKQNNTKQNKDLLEHTLRYNCIIMIPIIVALIVMAPKFVPWFLGKEFMPCIHYIQILSPVIILTIINYVLRMQYYVPLKRDKEYICSLILSTAVNFIVNILLVNPYGVYGVVIGTIVSEMIACIYLVRRSRSDVNYRMLINTCFIAIFCSMPMAFVINCVGVHKSSSIVVSVQQFIVGVCTYWVIYLLIEKLRSMRYEKM